jgi:sec-independent protein translocase protein TatC
LVIYFLTSSGIVSKNDFIEKRSYVIIFAFILGMLLTPPDVISQILLAIPICLLFEVGLFFSK